LNSSGFHLQEGREDGCHRVVHPHIDGAEFALDSLGRRFDLFVVGDVSW